MSVTRRRAAVLAGLLVTVAACGGGDDEEKAREAVRAFVDATNERDADRLCDELVTQEFVERTTGATGDNAREACKRQLRLTAPPVELAEITRVRIQGDRAEVTATLGAVAGAQRRVFRVEKEEGDWRVAGEAGG
jgi:hypothetical protein